MQNFYMRLLAVIFWIEQSFKKILSRKYGLAGILICLVVVGFFATVPLGAHAEICTSPGVPTADCTPVVPPVNQPVGGGQNLFDRIILTLADLALTVAVVLSKLIVAIIDILMPIMLYNQFSTSPVVSNGWAIVRDTVNMFFVIVLIAIAFGTIFGNERFKWQSQIVRLMIFAIVINFSKTLCGLMIDVGQVIMLTFANAIREIAAGNFIQMFGMGDIYALSPNASVFQSAASDSSAEGVKAFDWFASSLASVFMAAMVLGTMCMLLSILVYRIVMLWILIVISPLAWFVGGAKGLISSGAYAEWWKEFVGLIAVGPVLTFFLWLTLVVAGAGDISNSAQITTGASEAALTAGGFVTKAFELNRLISFVIAIAMLYAGFKAAASVAGGSGFVSKAISGGAFNNQAVNAVKGTAALGAKVGASGLRLGGRAAVGTVRGISNATGATDAISRKKESMMRGVSERAGTGKLGRFVARSAGGIADKEAAGRADKISEAGGKFKGDSRESKVDQLNRFAESPAGTPGGKREAQALLMDAMGDEKSMKDLRASGNLEKLWAEHGGAIQADAKGNKGMAASVEAFKKQNADITGSASQLKTVADVAGLSSFALADDKEKGGKLKAQMEGISTTHKKEGGGFYNAHEAMEAGLIGNKEQRDAMTKGRGAIYEGMSPQELSRVPAQSLAANATSALMEKNPGLAEKFAKDPKALGAMKDGLFSESMKSEGASTAFAAALSQKGGLNAINAAIKKDPNSEESKQLRSRVDDILKQANSKPDASKDVQKAHETFGIQMAALDNRGKKKEKPGEAVDFSMTVGEMNQKEEDVKNEAKHQETAEQTGALLSQLEGLQEQKKDFEAEGMEGSSFGGTPEQKAQIDSKIAEVEAQIKKNAGYLYDRKGAEAEEAKDAEFEKQKAAAIAEMDAFSANVEAEAAAARKKQETADLIARINRQGGGGTA